jgi:hypothetical protein
MVCLWAASSSLPQPSHTHDTSSRQMMQMDIVVIDPPQPLQEPLLYNSSDFCANYISNQQYA